MKTCIACRHFEMDEGQPDYSSMTPGWPPYISCSKRHEIDFNALSLLTKATDCPDYGLSELAKSKGWE